MLTPIVAILSADKSFQTASGSVPAFMPKTPSLFLFESFKLAVDSFKPLALFKISNSFESFKTLKSFKNKKALKNQADLRKNLEGPDLEYISISVKKLRCKGGKVDCPSFLIFLNVILTRLSNLADIYLLEEEVDELV